jgi:hypothetical protein
MVIGGRCVYSTTRSETPARLKIAYGEFRVSRIEKERENVSGDDLGTPVIDKPMTSTHVFIYILPRKYS